MIRLYDTMARKARDFRPIDKNLVKIYTCGPTVYDYPHIGNWYSFLRWDLLVRVLQANGYKTKWVMNITDVGHLTSDSDEGEDKLEKGAQREHKSAREIAKEYSDYFGKGLEQLNFIGPDILPKATDNIPEQIELIKILEKENLIYEIDDGIYFDTSKLSDYGKLAKLKTENQIVGTRVQSNVQKKNPTDFALWKFSLKNKKRDMEWDSPWGKGFPGWHLECSTLIHKFLGDTIDIHCGGIDHIPVHHTNEIAQSESVHGKKPLANYWLHSNFVKVNGQKISKSLDNIIILEDIKKHGFSLEAFRLLVLESHYRSEAEFTWDNLQAAQNRLKSYQAFADLHYQINPQNKNTGNIDYIGYTESFKFHLNYDLDTPKTLSTLDDLINQQVNPINESEESDFKKLLGFIDQTLDLNLLNSKDISKKQKELIQKREQTRKNNDFNTSDKIRNQLKDQGIEIRDTQYGPIWNRL